MPDQWRESIFAGETGLDIGQAEIEFVLEFSAKGLLRHGTIITTALKSVAQLRHPADYRYPDAVPKASPSHHKAY